MDTKGHYCTGSDTIEHLHDARRLANASFPPLYATYRGKLAKTARFLWQGPGKELYDIEYFEYPYPEKDGGTEVLVYHTTQGATASVAFKGYPTLTIFKDRH